jgi:hypothetical protein
MLEQGELDERAARRAQAAPDLLEDAQVVLAVHVHGDVVVPGEVDRARRDRERERAREPREADVREAGETLARDAQQASRDVEADRLAAARRDPREQATDPAADLEHAVAARDEGKQEVLRILAAGLREGPLAAEAREHRVAHRRGLLRGDLVPVANGFRPHVPSLPPLRPERGRKLRRTRRMGRAPGVGERRPVLRDEIGLALRGGLERHAVAVRKRGERLAVRQAVGEPSPSSSAASQAACDPLQKSWLPAHS